VDYDFIRADINSHKELFNIQEVGIDPWNMAAIAPKLIEDGFEVVQVRQGYASLSSPCKEFEKLILREGIHHDGNPVMNWCVENATVDRDPADNIKPKKDTNQFFRIDGVSATVTGLARLLEEESQRPSVYEGRGLRVIR
jgi:phage terminase large subunit-like protein